MSDDIRRSPFEHGPEDETLAGLSLEGARRWIDPVLSRGRFFAARRIVAIAMMALFFGLPHLAIGGRPALLVDLANRQLLVFGLTLRPADNVLLMVFGAGVVITVFFVTAVFGRIWCGWTCPQTVYLEFVFRPIETMVEGRPAVRRRRDAGGWTAERAARKASKYLLFALVGASMAATFVAYFVSWDGMVAALAAGDRVVWIAIAGLTALELVDFGFFREQTCTTACPYGRLQSVLVDADTLMVGYDAGRGEPRGRLEAGDGPRTQGDCIDCGRCVHTCPTGIDIRKGLQMECVACTQCIDACDDVMDRIKRPRGLVRYTSQRELATGTRRFARPRLIVYGTILLAVYAAFWFVLLGRPMASVEVLRASNEPFKVLPAGIVATQLRMRFTNHLDRPQTFTVVLDAPAGAELAGGAEPLVLAADEVETLTIAVKTPQEAFADGRAKARFRVESDQGLKVEREYVLLGPYQ
jgi:cytochrome c oxidase accessory protein FixG